MNGPLKSMETQRMKGNKQHSSRPEIENRINKENTNWKKHGNEIFKNLNSNLKWNVRDKISLIEGRIEEMAPTVIKMLNPKNGTKQPQNLGD